MSSQQSGSPLDGDSRTPADPWTVGIKAGGNDDAIHYRRHRWSRRTLCEQAARPRNVIALRTPPPDIHAMCWTCQIEAAKENL